MNALRILCLTIVGGAVAGAEGPPTTAAREILATSGLKGGLVVHLGCGDGTLTAALRASERYLVHGLDAEPGTVEKARNHIRSLGLYGPVSADRFDGKRLPYVENLVNLVVADRLGSVPMGEVMRVLAPGGVALIGGTRSVKPWPQELDEWPQFLYGPDNNAVSRDARVGIPRSIQWVAEPRWARSHEELASLSAAVTAAGRIYYIIDEAPLAFIRFMGQWSLVARDAFNGTLLWKRPIAAWADHLRHFRAGPVHLPRRLVAVGNTVYVTDGLAGPVIALDGATGETLRTFNGTERAEEIIASEGVLYLVLGTSEAVRRGGGLSARNEPDPTTFRCLAALEADTAKPLWKNDLSKENILPLSLAVRGQRAYFQSTTAIVCLDARTGSELWRTPRPTPRRRMSFSAPTLVATDEVVLCADRDTGTTEQDQPSTGVIEWGVHGWNEPGFARTPSSTLIAYDARSGKELWRAKCREGYNSPVDVFVIGGVAYVGYGFTGYDLKTGQAVRQIDTKAPRVGMTHHRCYRNKATERFIFTSKSGIEVLGIQEGRWLSNNSWIRGTCQYGIIPANGLLYAPPDACACFLTVKVPGFFAAAPQRDPSGHMPFPPQPVLERGPAFAEIRNPNSQTREREHWPMYRSDPARSGVAATTIPDALELAWSANIGGKPTQPAIAGGTVFVASTDAHAVHALSAADGKELWRFTAGGRIDSTPTIHNGMVLFGCADGWVYALRADDGALAWRFRAAPQDRRVCAYGQLESIWPVHGAVLVQNGILYALAGRTSYTDGGLVLYGLEPATGRQLFRTVLCHLDPETGQQLVPEANFNMEGTTSDVLSGDGELVYLKYFAFDRYGQRVESARPHLFSITSFLGEEWFVRSYWVLGVGQPGAGWGGWANAANANPFGRILCVTPEAVYGYGRQKIAGGAVGHKADAYHLFGMDRHATEETTGPKGKKAVRRGKLLWSDTASLTVRAMVLAGRRLAVAGPPDLGDRDPDLLAFRNEPDALAAFEGKKGVRLRILDAANGKTLSECPLPAMPAFDGLAAAAGRLYLATLDGALHCFKAAAR